MISQILDEKSNELGSKYPDSIKFKMIDDYEIKILKPYNLKPCPYTIIYTERCDVYEIRNNTLVIRQTELRKNDFEKPAKLLDKFDDDVLIEWQNGRLPSPIYLSYFEVDNVRFKCNDTTYPTSINLKGKNYIFTNEFGLYIIK